MSLGEAACGTIYVKARARFYNLDLRFSGVKLLSTAKITGGTSAVQNYKSNVISLIPNRKAPTTESENPMSDGM